MKNCNKLLILLLLILLIAIIINTVFNYTNIIQENYNNMFEQASEKYNESIELDSNDDIIVKDDKHIEEYHLNI